MNPPDPAETLLKQLSGGDAETAQRVFVTYEPYLRMVVRRHLSAGLRAKFDSVDIVQSIWADLLTGFRHGRWEFADPQQLRAFLVKATYNRLVDRVRQQQTPLRLEQRLGPELRELPQRRASEPADRLEADELWQ